MATIMHRLAMSFRFRQPKKNSGKLCTMVTEWRFHCQKSFTSLFCIYHLMQIWRRGGSDACCSPHYSPHNCLLLDQSTHPNVALVRQWR